MSRIFAFEKWQLLITALEVYRYLQPYGRNQLSLPQKYELRSNTQLEYSGQLILAHECFYEFRESAKFIALMDWDDLLITTKYQKLGDAFQAALTSFPDAAYFRVNN
uniref:Glycosyltransferase family 92 protein n=1 Tax=Ditylenchus dipsaci TaxID=166011 RepID=A0A915EQR5_9BILA